jgi:hypothetical protein
MPYRHWSRFIRHMVAAGRCRPYGPAAEIFAGQRECVGDTTVELAAGMAGTGTGVLSIAVRFNGRSSNAIPASAIRT